MTSHDLHLRFAPTRYRGSMMAAVFFCQPLGQLIALLMAFAVTSGYREQLEGARIGGDMQALNMTLCSINASKPVQVDCARSMDMTWRLVTGLGTVPAVIAMIFRFTIPESVR